jgi:ribosome-binding protein aMBF1 (putative translation factor)
MKNDLMEKHRQWYAKDAAYRAEYDAVEDEFVIAEALIKARTLARLTQQEVAGKMNTSQSYVARLESGRIKPSFAALMRYAKATGSKLKVELVSEK